MVLWFCLALIVGISGRFHAVSAPVVAATVWISTAIALFVCWKAGHPKLGGDCRSSLVDRAASHPICRILFSVSLSAWAIAPGLRRAGRNWRYYRRAHRGNASRHFSVPPTAGDFVSLERVWFDRYCLRRFFRAEIWIKRLAINRAVTRTPPQPVTDVSRAFDYRLARFDLCPAGQA